MLRNRVKDFFSKEEYSRLYHRSKPTPPPWEPFELESPSSEKETLHPLQEEKVGILEETLKKFISEIYGALSTGIDKDFPTQLQRDISSLKKENTELRRKIDQLYEALLPILETFSEEIELDKKILKEMPELKFKKKDPFVLEKGDWAVPHERLKELLEEE